MAWYYKSFFLMGEYGGAGRLRIRQRQHFNPHQFQWIPCHRVLLSDRRALTRRVNVVKPRRDFNFDFFKGGPFSPGAWEVYARYSTLDIGNNIFTSGFADPNLWTNHAWTTDIGLNWYLNFYTRIYLDWQHAGFATPCQSRPGVSLQRPTCSGCDSRSFSENEGLVAAYLRACASRGMTRTDGDAGPTAGKRVHVEPVQYWFR